jgi:hypothetical protein
LGAEMRCWLLHRRCPYPASWRAFSASLEASQRVALG